MNESYHDTGNSDNAIARRFFMQYELLVDMINMNLNLLTDEELKAEIFTGKNHGIWLLGHLIASDDDFSVYLGKGELIYPEYQDMFAQGSKLLHPEKYPDAFVLRKHWKDICFKNMMIYEGLKDSELDKPHEMVKDFEKDFFKTKMRVIIYWQLHQAYHTGQLGILVSKAGKSKF